MNSSINSAIKVNRKVFRKKFLQPNLVMLYPHGQKEISAYVRGIRIIATFY